MHNPDDRSFIGHPRGLGYIAFAEAWERFSYYGMQALLVLYMVNRLLHPGHIENIFGFGPFRHLIESFRGPVLEKGLEILRALKDETGLPVLSDIHDASQAAPAGAVLDIIQIPAFLCRQTDLIAAAARTGKPVGVKKGQFLSPEETKNILQKGQEVGNDRVFITERGTTFGYQNLVVDMRAFPIIRELGAPVVYDITHSMQKPGGEGKQTGGTPQFARPLARAAAAAGADGFFMEVHDNPPEALSDRTTQLKPYAAREIIEDILAIRDALAKRA